jgi:hypothetical protein
VATRCRAASPASFSSHASPPGPSRHEPHQSCVALTAFTSNQSPLRHRAALASCLSGGQAIWWPVDVASEQDALQLLPFFVAQRLTVTRVTEVVIP